MFKKLEIFSTPSHETAVTKPCPETEAKEVNLERVWKDLVP